MLRANDLRAALQPLDTRQRITSPKLQRQIPLALAGRSKQCVGKRRRRRRRAGLADAGGRGIGFDDSDLDLRHLVHPQHRVIMEVALLHGAVPDRDLALEGSGETKLITQFNLLSGQIARLQQDFAAAYEYLQKAEGNASIKTTLESEIQQLTSDVVNAAIAQSEAQEFVASSNNLFLAYQINPEANVDYLYYSATNAVNASDYALALERYIILRDIEYTGVVTKYYATEVASQQEIEISETEFSIFSKSKDYTNLRQEDTPSRFPEIVKNIALIYTQLGQKEKAIQAVQDARKANPGDVSLILTEANIYIELGEKDRYQTLVLEALEADPTNATLYFNLGVVTTDLGDKEKAVEFYNKAIELDPQMENAYLNLVALILEDEASVVEEMNSLGNSRADNLRYDELKVQREELYKKCVPILKKLLSIDDSNLEAAKTLRNIYGTIGDNDGFMEMKALIEKYEQ